MLISRCAEKLSFEFWKISLDNLNRNRSEDDEDKFTL